MVITILHKENKREQEKILHYVQHVSFKRNSHKYSMKERNVQMTFILIFSPPRLLRHLYLISNTLFDTPPGN